MKHVAAYNSKRSQILYFLEAFYREHSEPHNPQGKVYFNGLKHTDLQIPQNDQVDQWAC